MAQSHPSNRPARAMNTLPVSTSSAGQPYRTTVPSIPRASSSRFTAMAAPVWAAPIRLWPQAWPAPPGTSGSSVVWVFWLKPGRASNSARMAMQGFPWPQRATNPVSSPATGLSTAKPSSRRMDMSRREV